MFVYSHTGTRFYFYIYIFIFIVIYNLCFFCFSRFLCGLLVLFYRCFCWAEGIPRNSGCQIAVPKTNFSLVQTDRHVEMH